MLREGGNHTVYVNPAAQKVSAVPRHREINQSSREKSAGTWKSRNPSVAVRTP